MANRFTAIKDVARQFLCLMIVTACLFGGIPAHAQSASANDPRVVRIPMDTPSEFCRGEITWEAHREYHIDLLRLALRLSGHNATLVPICMDYPTEDRRIPMLEAADQFDTVFFGTNAEREERLLAVYIPIYLGTTGLRLFMLHKDLKEPFSQIETIDDLRKLSMGQGLGWPDNEILTDSGFDVVSGRYRTLHRMLDARRFDLYPRAYWQIAGEWNWMKWEAPGIEIAQKTALYYPQPIYFFVSPKNPDLRDIIETGLKRAFSNGMMLDLLKTHRDTAPSFSQIDLHDLKVMRIENKHLSDRSREAMAQYSLFD
ncbi:hypothetical protein DY252_03350 [Thalassospira indica]|uniref:Solute-binding protein family 3/N-terminal domain-containing protein n=2 Tax=Thalassospira indica TaxID=1891279 RepID=A0ABN5NB68_9PROT|nr:hypothetical protein DY252_03350 [Thalassospira indica]